MADSLRSAMREDLLFERLFSIVEGAPAPAKAAEGGKLDAGAWEGVGAQVVVSGEAKADGPDVRLECRIYDVSSGKVLWETSARAPSLTPAA